MCGIIGYVGNKRAQDILLAGLKRMEYRGYDSAGIATCSNQDVTLLRAKGKVAALGKLVNDNLKPDTIGIGHTRWATHGEPSIKNAHPHRAGKIYVVHNGIVENYSELKKKIENKGIGFTSETDTEVIAQLISLLYESQHKLTQAVKEALKQIRGTFGLVVLCEDRPDILIAARRGSPLIIGKGTAGAFIASDPTAMVGFARKIVYLEDDEIATVSTKSIDVFDINYKRLEKTTEDLKLESRVIQKSGYDHFLIKEIMEQPDSVTETLRGHVLLDEGTSRLGGIHLNDRQIRQVQRIVIIGCGSAFYAGLLGKYLLERITNIAVDVELASEFRYRQPVLMNNTIGVVISQSGETADTLASLRELKNKGIYTHGLVNAIGSTIAREVNGGMYLHVGPEISVASTKAFTSQVVGLILFGLYIARKRRLSLAAGQEILEALIQLPNELEKALDLNEIIKKRAAHLFKFNHALYMGRDTLYPIALEGALKLKEISYIHAEGYSAGEMKHGPIALIDHNLLTVFLLGKGNLFEKTRTNLEEVKARKGPTLVVTNDKKCLADEKSALYVNTNSEWTAPLIINTVLQLLAYHIAVARDRDVDQPRNLAKSVTVE